MARRPIPIKVKAADLARIDELLRGGLQQVRVVLRALTLRQLARGRTAPQVAETVSLSPKAVREIAHRYNSGGLERALYERQRPGAKPLLDDSQRQRIIAMVCSDPPEVAPDGPCAWWPKKPSSANWFPEVGRETIRVLLLHHDLKPWREKNVVRGRTR